MHNRMLEIDKPLHEALNRATLLYYQGRHRRELRQIFRAIAVSFHACRMLTETDSTWYDLGTRIVDWVSSFEILVHPGRGRVGPNDVYRLVNDIRWFDTPQSPRAPRVAHRRYKYPVKNGRYLRENAACHFYRRLYKLRNDFAHGNPLKQSNRATQAGKSDGPRIDQIAPLLFRECVFQRLRELEIVPRFATYPMSREQYMAFLIQSLPHGSFHDAFAVGLGLHC